MGERVTNDDIARAADHVGCEPAAIRAVIAVEAGGSGFDDQGRPRVLFEKHYFYRLLPEGPLRSQAIAAHLARPTWVRDYPNTDGIWDQIKAACDISEDAALQSCSWGLGQVMGTYWADAGYDSVQDLVKAMYQSEGAQLDLMVGYIVKNGLGPALRDHDWAGFAQRYNGPGYAQNNYDTKLAAAYQQFA